MVNHMRDIDKEIANAEKVKNLYAQRLEAAEQLLQALQDQRGAAESERKARAILGQPTPLVSAVSAIGVPGIAFASGEQRARYGKPNTQLFEEVLLEHGKPMHMSSLLDAALARGLQFRGKRAPIVQMRTALSNCKRIYNIGGNTWWIIDQPVPEKLPATNGHGRSIGVPSASSVPLV